ncbi:MAG: 50S ribosomal protein L23 [Oceanococcus sp.]
MTAARSAQERAFQVLLAPLVTEKSSRAAEENNVVVFEVATTASKPEIRRAVESLFDVKVAGVTTVNVNGKTKRFGRGLGRRSDWKKAYVKLAEGQEIDFTSGVK